MKTILMTVVLAFAGSTISAQSGTLSTPEKDRSTTQEVKQTQDVKQACNMPDMNAVKGLGLSQEQEMQVRQITAECQRDCAQAMKEDGSVNKEVMAKHQARIQEVLTPEQYARYSSLTSKETERKNAPAVTE